MKDISMAAIVVGGEWKRRMQGRNNVRKKKSSTGRKVVPPL